MRLYYSPGACSLASHIVLHEANIDASITRVDLKTKRTEGGEDFSAINPKGYVPALKLDDGDLLTENVAVLSYLASLGNDLLPDSGMAKWHAIETLAFVSTEIHKAFKPLFDPTATDDAKTKAKELITKRLEIADRLLGERPFIVGNTFTVVDAYLFVTLTWADKKEIKLSERLARYMAKLSERPSVKKAFQAEGLK